MEKASAIVLKTAFENDLIETCRRRLPVECCGFVLGEISGDGAVTANGIAVVRNAAARPEAAFRFEPDDYVRVYGETQKNRRNVVGFFHSHPAGDAVPSSEDGQGMSGSGTYWIVGFGEKGNPRIAVYRPERDGTWSHLPMRREPL